MTSARAKHLLWYEVWGSLELLTLLFAWAVSYGGQIGSELIAPATFVAFLFGLGGALCVHGMDAAAVRDLIRFPVWILLGFCVGVRTTGGYAFFRNPAVESVVNGLAWAGMIAGILVIGWVSVFMEAPVPQEEGCCSECGYDLTGTARRCPECGHLYR